MAPPKKTEKAAEAPRPASASKALALLKASNPYTCFIADSKLSDVEEWIDTGNYVLNAMVSKDLTKGFPDNKVVLLGGENSTGKTLICLAAAKAAQKKGKIIIWVDTEFAITDAGLRNLGLDTEAFIHMPVKSIENCRNTLVNFLRQVEVDKEHGKYAIFIDSLANMESEMEDARIEKDNTSMDMGTKARAIGSLLRNLNNWCGFTRTACIVTNHIYDNPGDMMAKYNPVKNQSGGKKAGYIPSIVIQLSIRRVDGEDAKDELGGTAAVAGQHKFSGQFIDIYTVKNRFAKPYLKSSIFLSYDKGLSKYAGLGDLAETLGVVSRVTEKARNYHIVSTGEVIGSRKEWLNDKAVYEKLIPLINEKIAVAWKYNPADDENLETEEDTLDEPTE